MRVRPVLAGIALATAVLVIAPAGVSASCAPPGEFTAQGRHFAVEAIVCATPPARGLRVDAQMPEHRHGMNYRPQISASGEGRYLAEGFLFHMPGRWQLVFDVDRDGQTERLATDLVLE
jgi:hypothetical protein